MAAKLTAQQKAERGRTKTRKIQKMNALDKSIIFGTPMKTKNKDAKKKVR